MFIFNGVVTDGNYQHHLKKLSLAFDANDLFLPSLAQISDGA
jgi:hypothetical protein